MSRLPTHAFGYIFTHLPEHARQDVESLEREGVLYADLWVDEVEDFRHTRIRLTPEEAKDFARRSWAYELWLRAGMPKWAREVPGIDPDIAQDADSYSLTTKDGTAIPPPYHCFAAFMGQHLELILMGAAKERGDTIESMVDRQFAASATVSHPVDIGIIVALKEEARELLDLAGHYKPCGEGGLNSYLFDRASYRCAVSLVGSMGELEAARVTERHIAVFDPTSIVVIGISGGVHDDLRVGDTYVPFQTVQYIQDAKASPTEAGGFQLVPGPPAIRSDYDLHTKASGVDLNHPVLHKCWREQCGEDFAAIVPSAKVRRRLFGDDLVRKNVEFLAAGHEASGPVVSAAASFSSWIRTFDRNVKAIDMESAAVLTTAHSRQRAKPAIAIRGISDYGDDRKAKLDAIGGGSLRKYAMRNAVRFLWLLLDAKILPLGRIER